MDIHRAPQLLNCGHVRERGKALPRGVLVGGFGNGFLLEKVRGQPGSPWAENPSVLLGLTLLGCSLSGTCWLSFMRKVLLTVCLTSVMSGLMGAWFRIPSEVLVLRGLVFLLIFLVTNGLAGSGAIGMMMLVKAGANRSCRGYCSVPGPLESVQRAEFWSVILALQAADAVHLGVDNLGVVRHVGRLIDGT